jgi:hypothetical protein
MKSYSQSPKYKFRYIIPKDYEEALKLDELNQNIKWEDATVTEMSQLKEYECFIDAGIYGRDKSSLPLFARPTAPTMTSAPMLYFSFYKPVYYLVDETTFPSESKELCR